jgi:hypothetical protein
MSRSDFNEDSGELLEDIQIGAQVPDTIIGCEDIRDYF